MRIQEGIMTSAASGDAQVAAADEDELVSVVDASDNEVFILQSVSIDILVLGSRQKLQRNLDRATFGNGVNATD